MTEDDAQNWIRDRFGSEALARTQRFVDLLRDENTAQNLVSAVSLDAIWARHIVDSAQLIGLAQGLEGWLDIGTGAGFPGIVVAIMTGSTVVMVEPRRRRAEFLSRCVSALRLTEARVIQQRVEQVRDEQAMVISARAVASIDAILRKSTDLRTPTTQYLLPRGIMFANDLEDARRGWHGVFHVKHSVTDPTSGIVIAEQVHPK